MKIQLKTLLALLLLIPSLSWGKIFGKKYCSVLENKIKVNIQDYFTYTKNISDWSSNDDLVKSTLDMLEKVKKEIHEDSITWANLCK